MPDRISLIYQGVKQYTEEIPIQECSMENIFVKCLKATVEMISSYLSIHRDEKRRDRPIQTCPGLDRKIIFKMEYL